ncbi:adenosylcobalamin/alpha-ribazole phosphatase [Photorhabdus temperata]|uniref:Alpha-ribazole phosphatase n=1 Tax=Photorhabdus temperata subsp. temperata Meg1 TaxID=1393735 RepID=A0A081RUU5_PHOTE|nr:adenosylcobalamin/alpha-ribazole phosphatase [Photorhabdus temperata]KER02448.1 adenosylcobalamin phosphatase [Photorhabdus temperata subsp. temperata Meg1]MCT8348578.1 adenosylcobalamin/alpha-ribazole phosphatase [Photorhabdus temperata]
MRLFLVRHGQTEANLSGVFCGMTDVELTETGINQARQVARYLSAVTFSQAISSMLQRARHTAEIILADRRLSAGINAQLNEMHFGAWEMRHHHDLQYEDAEAWAAWLAYWQQASPTGGETFPAFAARIENVAQQLLKQENQDNLLLVAHQGVLGLLLARLLAMPPSAMWHFHFEQGAYSVVEIHHGFTTLRTFNSRACWQPETRE